MDRHVSLWERWTETAGWLGVRVRHSAPQEGELAVGRDSASSGRRVPPYAWGQLLSSGYSGSV